MKEKHIVIMTDLEGISMVDNISMMQGEGYERACHFLMEDLNAAIDGAFAGGAKKVSVVDGHSTGKNFPEGLLDPRAAQIPTLLIPNIACATVKTAEIRNEALCLPDWILHFTEAIIAIRL